MIAKASFFIDILPGAINGCTIVVRPLLPSAQKTQLTSNYQPAAMFAKSLPLLFHVSCVLHVEPA